jgi:GT2 family glycosyltransferase
MASSKNNVKVSFKSTNQFDLLKNKTSFTLKNKQTNGIIETDEMGYKLLTYLPASIRSVKDRFASEGFTISDSIVDLYFLLFHEAGIIKKINSNSHDEGRATSSSKKTGSIVCKNVTISVIIVTRNSERFILKNLASIYNQTLLPSEVIVVDNDSTDSTLLSVKNEFPRVKIIENKKNLHYAKSVNIGIKQAEGDLFIVLNDDIELEFDFIERIYQDYENAENKDQIAAISPVIRFNKLRRFINSVGNIVLKNNWGADNFMGVVDLGQFKDISSLGSVCFGAVAIPRRAWEIVGEMDCGFKFYDDIDWCFRSHLEGLKIRFDPEAIAYHEFGGTYPAGIKLTFIVKSRLRYVIKNFPLKRMFEFVLNYIALDIKNNLFLPKQREMRKFLSYMKGYLLLLLELPGIFWYRLKRNRVSETQLNEFYKKSPPFTALVNHDSQPLITTEVIEKYYSRLPYRLSDDGSLL